MKTPEDEAFDDLARKQGAWGGGFPAKRAMAADKQHWNEEQWRKNNWRCNHGWLRGEQCEICNAAQEPPSNCEKWRNSMDDEDDDIQDYKKPWVGLTDEDKQKLAAAQFGWEDLCLAVEAKLKEKNT